MSQTERLLVRIGTVRNAVPKGSSRVDWKSVVSRIEIQPEYTPGLQGVEEFSHLYVLFLLEEGDIQLKVHPRRRPDLPEVGLFASRSPQRPNSIALTLVRLIGVEGSSLEVQGLDAYDGTGVLDIKPFMLESLPEGLRFPDWIGRLG